ncbi:MAG TPA: hypothetical protein VFQ44_01295 [Streptosporangiaceae bacterium]|nr:hypothetical protein [Streptosporangiaceae bacterium]
MAIYALISPGGSPGCTTATLALALAWPRQVIVAECDPGGGDILAGLFAGHLQAPRGLLGVAFEASRGPAAVAAELATQLVPLDESGQRRLLAGISDPRQALGLSPVWPAISAGFASQPADVLADCGRFDAGVSQPLSLLADAAAIIMVMRPTLRQVAGARPRIDLAAQIAGGRDRIGLLLVGDSGIPQADLTRTLDVPVLGTLPEDAKTARVLSDGEGQRTHLDRRPLMRAARVAGQAVARRRAPLPERAAGQAASQVASQVASRSGSLAADLSGGAK